MAPTRPVALACSFVVRPERDLRTKSGWGGLVCPYMRMKTAPRATAVQITYSSSRGSGTSSTSVHDDAGLEALKAVVPAGPHDLSHRGDRLTGVAAADPTGAAADSGRSAVSAVSEAAAGSLDERVEQGLGGSSQPTFGAHGRRQVPPHSGVIDRDRPQAFRYVTLDG